MRRHGLPHLPAAAVVAVAGGTAVLAGGLMAIRPEAGMATALGAAFLTVALVDLPLALVLWTPVPFVQGLPVVWIGPTVASAIVVLAWFATTATAAGHGEWRAVRRAAAAVALLLTWTTLTVGWGRREDAAAVLVPWWTAGLITLVFATTPTAARHLRLVAIAFVGGAVLSVTIGLASAVITPVSDTAITATYFEGRLSGGSGDPNHLAAGLVPAIVLAAGVAASTRSLLVRLAMAGAAGVAAIGLAASQSRGGFVAALVAALVALAVMGGHRRRIAAGSVGVAAIVSGWLAATPSALDRIIEAEDGGSGRSDLWTVALRMAGDHPVTGVGLGDYPVEAGGYVREPGRLDRIDLIVDEPQEVHNMYLQALAETGAVGLLLLLLAVGTLLVLPLRAARRFDASGDRSMATLARAVFVAQAGSLAAMTFLSYGTDPRMWLLLGLGGALMAVAQRSGQEPSDTHGWMTRRRSAQSTPPRSFPT